MIGIYSDFIFEPTAEEIIITLLAEGSTVQIGTNNKTTIELNQQDGKMIGLFWDENATDVDMDLFLRFGDNFDFVFASSVIPDTEFTYEIIIIPSIFTAGASTLFGLSYNYYEGTLDPLAFEVQFADYFNGTLEPVANREIFNGSYTIANVNPYETSGIPPAIIQTVNLDNGVFTNFSLLDIPSTGSRAKTSRLAKPIIRDRINMARSRQKFK
jgi:hypothetical protein